MLITYITNQTLYISDNISTVQVELKIQAVVRVTVFYKTIIMLLTINMKKMFNSVLFYSQIVSNL